MTTEPLPAIEPVTDEDAHEASLSYINDTPMAAILEQDRRRVAERRVGRQSDYNPTSPSHEAANAELARIASVIDDAREIERLRAEVAAHRKHDVLRCDALMKAEAEVAKLNAACAAKDAALRLLTDMDELRETDELYIARAALSDTAGKGWIDATGAVEATTSNPDPKTPWLPYVWTPADWAGKRVLIVKVGP